MHRTYSQSVQSFVPNVTHQELIQDAVRRMHEIKLLASEFFTLHINRCLDTGVPVPEVTQSFVRDLFMRASVLPPKNATKRAKAEGAEDSRGTGDSGEVAEASRLADESVAATLAQLEPSQMYARASRSGLTQLLSTEANGLVATFGTNIARHYKTRVHRFVRWTFAPEERIPHDDYMLLKTEMVQVAHDLCKHGREPRTSPAEYHTWVQAYRDMFGLSTLLESESLEYALKNTPHLFLRSMRMMCRTFERSGLRTFALVPLTTRLRPGFVGFDTRSIGEVLQCWFRAYPRAASAWIRIRALIQDGRGICAAALPTSIGHFAEGAHLATTTRSVCH